MHKERNNFKRVGCASESLTRLDIAVLNIFHDMTEKVRNLADNKWVGGG